MAILLSIGVVILVGYLIWWKGRPAIICPLYGMDWLQYQVLSLTGLLGPHGHQMLRYVQATLTWTVNPNTVSFSELRATQMDVGHRVRFATVVIPVVMAIWVMMKMKGDGLKRSFTLSGESKQNVYRWFGIRLGGPFLGIVKFLEKVFLVKKLVPLVGVSKKSEWASNGANFMAYQAEHWKITSVGARFRPDDGEKNLLKAMTPCEWMNEHGVTLSIADGLDDDLAEKAFAKQLGEPWSGIASQPLHTRAFAILAYLNFSRAGKKLENYRNDVAFAFSTGNLSAVKALVDPFMADKEIISTINNICKRNYYTNVAMLSLVGKCGPFEEWGGGDSAVIAPAMFLWLKRYDRTLFYVLQNHGRRAFFVEGAGAVSHFFFEHISDTPTSEPQMDNAIDGLSRYLEIHEINDIEVFTKRMNSRR